MPGDIRRKSGSIEIYNAELLFFTASLSPFLEETRKFAGCTEGCKSNGIIFERKRRPRDVSISPPGLRPLSLFQNHFSRIETFSRPLRFYNTSSLVRVQNERASHCFTGSLLPGHRRKLLTMGEPPRLREIPHCFNRSLFA